MAIAERRSMQRYPIKLRLSVRPAGAPAAAEIQTESRNVSSHGVFFVLEQPVKSGSSLDIVLTMPSELTRDEPVRVRCEARVQRTENLGQGQVGVAAKIERYRFLAGKRERRAS